MRKSNEDVFAVSLTELLLIITFALLIVMSLYQSTLSKAHAKLENVQNELREVLDEAKSVANPLGIKVNDFHSDDNIIDYIADLDELFDDIDRKVNSDNGKKVLSYMTLENAWSTLVPLADENIKVSELLKRIKAIENIKNEYEVKVKKGLLVQAGLKDTIVKQKNIIEYYENTAKNGRVLPPCWFDGDKIEYVYHVFIYDEYVEANPVLPDYRFADFYKITNDSPRKIISSSKEFMEITNPFYSEGKKSSPECRFYVKMEDRTSSTSKIAFQTSSSNIEANFFKLVVKHD